MKGIDESKSQPPPINKEVSGSRYAQHPWRALLIIIGMLPVSYVIVGSIVFGLLHQPMNFTSRGSASAVVVFTIGNFIAYVLTPFILRIPKGKRSIKGYLDDIGLTKIRPFMPLFWLTVSCLLILIVCMGSFSIIYRLYEGQPVTSDFIFTVFNLSLALPPVSMLLFKQILSMFEEVAFRGVFLTMLLEKHSQRNAIIFSALVFGGAHLFMAFSGQPIIVSIGQVTWAFLFGLFYGYLFVKTGSLLPPMIIHWLSNVVQAPLTAYYLNASPTVRALGGVFGYGLAAILLILWVRFFVKRFYYSV